MDVRVDGDVDASKAIMTVTGKATFRKTVSRTSRSPCLKAPSRRISRAVML